jgi:hypothetical protein
MEAADIVCVSVDMVDSCNVSIQIYGGILDPDF